MRHRIKVSPIRVRSFDAELDCHVVAIVAYQAVCSCGWRSPSKAKFGQARHAGRVHLRPVEDVAARH